MGSKMFVGVKGLVEKDGKILTVKIDVYDKIIHALPGGRIEYGENPVEALQREVTEEVSAEIEPVEPVGMYHFFMGEDNDGEQVVLTVWDVEWKGEISTDTAHAEEDGIVGYEWLKPGEFSSKNVAPELVKLIEDLY